MTIILLLCPKCYEYYLLWDDAGTWCANDEGCGYENWYEDEGE